MIKRNLTTITSYFVLEMYGGEEGEEREAWKITAEKRQCKLPNLSFASLKEKGGEVKQGGQAI